MIIYHNLQEIDQNLLNQIFEYHDGSLYWKINVGLAVKNEKAGFVGSAGYVRVGLLGKEYREHRLIYLYHHGHLPEFVDHIDGNRLNNHIENLRQATRAENNRNSKINSKNVSGVKGVHWNKKANKWESYCGVNGKRHYLGIYTNKEDAIKVVKEFREIHHGEFFNHG